MTTLEINDEIYNALNVPAEDRPQVLKQSLACALYAQGHLSFERAHALADLPPEQFTDLLDEQGLTRTAAPEARLVAAVEAVLETTDAHQRLAELKEEAQARREHDDQLWHLIILSFATWGNSRGHVLATEESNYKRVSWERVQEFDAAAEGRSLEAHFESVLRDCNVRYPSRKAGYLVKNVDLIEGFGGPAAAMTAAEEKDGWEAKVNFLKQFTGLGDKYARNVWMDIHHPDVRDVIALDTRIQNISEVLGLEDRTYESEEEFYTGVAADVGLSPWELDRVLYRYTDDIEAKLHP